MEESLCKKLFLSTIRQHFNQRRNIYEDQYINEKKHLHKTKYTLLQTMIFLFYRKLNRL